MALRRSVLLVGGDDEATQRRAITQGGADLVCLDLEDTVVPDRKPAARAQIARLLAEDIWGRTARAYRINAASTPWWRDDLLEVLRPARGRVDTVFLSKVDTPDDVRCVDEVLEQLTRELGLKHTIRMTVGIETAQALTAIDAIASASKRIESLGFAIGDLSTSLGVRVGPYLHNRALYPGDLFHFVKSRINLAAKTNGLLSLDGPWPMINDHATLAEDARWGAMLGLDGKMALAIEQVRVIHEAYRPTEAELTRARMLVQKYEEAVAQGRGHGLVNGEFIDLVTLAHARDTISRSEAPL